MTLILKNKFYYKVVSLNLQRFVMNYVINLNKNHNVLKIVFLITLIQIFGLKISFKKNY